jgi:murein DD-endopeptidase MepM/ murein hydrolase activator NlpD
LYIYKHKPSRGIPILVGLAAFILTMFGVIAFVILNAPPELLAAFNLSTVKTSIATPTTDLSQDPNVTPTSTITLSRKRTRVSENATPVSNATPTAGPTLLPTATSVNFVEHFLIGRPVPPDADGNVPQWTYLYGTTQHGNASVHHGEEFVNPIGTPLLAVADGTVVVAGPDTEPVCGEGHNELCGDHPDFYGKLVVVQLDQTYNDQPLYTLCGHMSSVAVTVGQHLRAGERIGAVGDTGIAIGPHCHFEVRLGVNDYAHTRNPILWMKPLPGHGSLAGRAQDRNGNLVRSLNVFLYLDNATNDYVEDTETYGRDEHPPVNSDDALQENWAMGDVPVGKYLLRVKIGDLNYQRHITIEDGKLLFVILGGA